MNANEVKPGTRCQCQDRTHPYDETRLYARHNVGTCPNRAVRLVTVRYPSNYQVPESLVSTLVYLASGVQVAYIPMCAPCAEWHEHNGTK